MELALQTIVAHKGLEPVLLEVKELCSFADYFIICSGGSRRHVLALAQHLEEALAQTGIKPLGVEGVPEGLWVLLDYNTMVIHIFFQSLRDFYNLEGLWSEAPRTEFQTVVSQMPSSFSPQESISHPETDPERIRHE